MLLLPPPPPPHESKKEEKENGVFQVDDNMDFSIEERLMQKQTNMKLAYQNIIKKHKNYNDFNKINELDRFSVDVSEDGSNIYSSRKKLKIILYILLPNYNYSHQPWQKRSPLPRKSRKNIMI